MPTLTASEKTLRWLAVDNATGYQIKVNDEEWSDEQTDTSYTLVAWDVAYNNLRIGFSTSAVLRYSVYDANGNKIGEDEVAFAEKGDIGRWFQTFKANLNGKDMSSFSIKLFSAYGDNEALAAGTEIIVAACNGHTF